MKVPIVKQCCCGCTLETGSAIIGWLQLIGGILYGIAAIITMATKHEFAGSIVEILYSLFEIALALLLLTGIKARLPNRIKLYVTISFILLIFFVVYSIIRAIILFTKADPAMGASFLIAGLIGAAIQAYFLVVVYNFKREMSSSNQNI